MLTTTKSSVSILQFCLPRAHAEFGGSSSSCRGSIGKDDAKGMAGEKSFFLFSAFIATDEVLLQCSSRQAALIQGSPSSSSLLRIRSTQCPWFKRREDCGSHLTLPADSWLGNAMDVGPILLSTLPPAHLSPLVSSHFYLLWTIPAQEYPPGEQQH